MGRLQEALNVYLSLNAIDPGNTALAERILNIVYSELDYKLLLHICRHFLENKFNYAVTYEYLSKLYVDFGQLDNALRHIENALAIEPNNDKYIQERIILQYQNGLFEQVLEYEKYILNNDTSEAHKNIPLIYAKSLAESGRVSDARNFYVNLLRQSNSTDQLNIINEIALLHQEIELNPQQAKFLFSYILKRDPSNPIALSNMALHETNTFALDAYQKACQLLPDNPLVNLNYSYALLDDGQLEQGFELYENRIIVHRKYLSHRVKRLESLENKKIFLWAEQGLGDHIKWAWFYQYLQDICSEVSIQVDKRLVMLLQRSFPGIRFTGEEINTLIETENFETYDAEIMMASLGLYFSAKIIERQANFKSEEINQSYLSADNDRVSYWQKKITSLTKSRAIGVCWRSGLQSKLRYLHSLDANDIVEIFKDLDCSIVNLQYGTTQEEIEILRTGLGTRFIHFDEIDLKDDQDDLAALISATAAVFTGPTAVHDLSGAIGADTLCFVHYGANDFYSTYGKPFDFAYPNLKYIGQKHMLLSELLNYFQDQLIKRFNIVRRCS
jgi:tetratricopeptide (TPR) repeat protein